MREQGESKFMREHGHIYMQCDQLFIENGTCFIELFVTDDIIRLAKLQVNNSGIADNNPERGKKGNF